ncbi:MAG TPA: hypothetical protein DET40_13060 [Lentisphaeria bacterium]|nr:MAG: hypothetical protein A2X45_19225 [Lentisphaerae bacterium GWF2_50_93]HCE44471.1 hypothetical protein [Lentisphaeria bacterium]
MLTRKLEGDILKLARKIGDSKFLPPERELAVMMNASRVTIRRALSSLSKSGFIHSISGRGNLITGPHATAATSAEPQLGIALMIPSYSSFPFRAKILTGWDNTFKKSYKCYNTECNNNEAQQLDKIRRISKNCKVLAICLISWKRNVFSPIPALKAFKNEIVFILDRDKSWPNLGYAVLNNENTGVSLAFDYAIKTGLTSGNLLYFGKGYQQYSSNQSRTSTVAKKSLERGLDIQIISLSHRPRNKIESVLSKLRRNKKICAFCSDNVIASELLYCSRIMGLKLNEDISIISLFDTPTEYFVPHVLPDFNNIGVIAACLSQKLEGGGSAVDRTILVDPVFVSGRQ